MTSPLQVLFYLAVTLAPPGTHHVVVSAGGPEAYYWDKGDSLDDVTAWSYDWAAVDPKQVPITNDIVPDDFKQAQHATAEAVKRNGDKCGTLYYDPAHALEKTSQGWVYVVRPGSANEKFYSFTFK